MPWKPDHFHSWTCEKNSIDTRSFPIVPNTHNSYQIMVLIDNENLEKYLAIAEDVRCECVNY